MLEDFEFIKLMDAIKEKFPGGYMFPNQFKELREKFTEAFDILIESEVIWLCQSKYKQNGWVSTMSLYCWRTLSEEDLKIAQEDYVLNWVSGLAQK